jgi:RHS repeat-associated protein
LDEETGLYYYGARYYDSRISLWLSTDPMQEKYPGTSVFAYCANNPVKYTDPDGREKLKFFNPEKDPNLAKGTENYKDDGAIHIFAHGNSKGIYPAINGKRVPIKSAKDFIKFLNEHSETWKNKKEGEEVTIVLHSCNTANESDGKDNSFARAVSKELGTDVTVVGATDYFWMDTGGNASVNKIPTRDSNGVPREDKNGNPKPDEKGDVGSWQFFEGGKATQKYDGRYMPKKEPTWWDEIRYKEN